MYNKITLNGDSDSSSEGITSYLELENLPTINAVTVKGNLTGDDLGLVSETADQDIFGAKNFTGTLTYKGVEVATESSVAEDISVKADKTELNAVAEEVNTLQETTEEIKTTLQEKAEQTQVDKVDKDLEGLIGVVNKTIDTVGALSDETKTKASATEVATALGEKADNSTVSALEATVENKADKTDITALQENLTNKADKTELENKADKTELPVVATIESIGLIKPDGTSIKIEEDGTIRAVGGGSGTSDYEELQNKPKINNVEIIGDKSAGDLGLATTQDIEDVNAILTVKADKTDITALQENLTNKADKTELENKADKSEVATLTETVNTLSTAVESKAEQSDITALQETLANKADKTELPTVATTTHVGTVKPDGTTITITEDGTISATSSGGDTSVPVTPLTYAESINLEVDKAYTLTATGNVAFVLPTVTGTSVLPQIFMQFKMDTVVTIDLGTSTYFKKSAPDMTVAGIYNIVWEYDLNNGVWVVDSVVKGEVE